VWDYPRPPRIEPTEKPIQVVFGGRTVAETQRAKRVLETSHPPAYYIPPEDVCRKFLEPSSRESYCEWKGMAVYFSVVVGARRAKDAAWSYPEPNARFESIGGYLAFYPGLMDACFVGGVRVEPQPGDFYGGWVTPDIVGPFKGGHGTMGW
jgi:uncharacterized protein (DUF427 family)